MGRADSSHLRGPPKRNKPKNALTDASGHFACSILPALPGSPSASPTLVSPHFFNSPLQLSSSPSPLFSSPPPNSQRCAPHKRYQVFIKRERYRAKIIWHCAISRNGLRSIALIQLNLNNNGRDILGGGELWLVAFCPRDPCVLACVHEPVSHSCHQPVCMRTRAKHVSVSNNNNSSVVVSNNKNTLRVTNNPSGDRAINNPRMRRAESAPTGRRHVTPRPHPFPPPCAMPKAWSENVDEFGLLSINESVSVERTRIKTHATRARILKGGVQA